MTSESRPHIDPDAPSLGTYLAARRLERNLSAEEIAAATGIHLSIIRALEAGDHANLPSPVFVRGFIKIYAKALEIDPAKPLALYDQEAPRGESAPPIGPDILSKESLTAAPLVSRRKLFFAAALLLAGLFLVFYFHWTPPLPFLPSETSTAPSVGQAEQHTANAPPASESRPSDSSNAGANAPVTAPAAPSSSPEAEPQPATQAHNGYTLTATFSAPTWMRVTVDNGPPQEAFYQKGSQHQWRAEERFELLIGNGGGVRLFLNGQPVPFSGATGQVVRLSLP